MIKNNKKSAEILRAEEQLAQAKARLAEAKRKEGAMSIPAHFEPPVRTLRATIPVNEIRYSGARKPPFR